MVKLKIGDVYSNTHIVHEDVAKKVEPPKYTLLELSRGSITK